MIFYYELEILEQYEPIECKYLMKIVPRISIEQKVLLKKK